jgi:hypothetical protein
METFGQPSMASVVNPQPEMAAMQTAPPTTPQELDSRKSLWGQLLDDPNMKSSLLRMGMQMMQGQRPNESALGATARAGMDAMDYYGVKNELDRKRAREAGKDTLEANRVNADIRQTDAATANTEQTTSQNAAKFAEWQGFEQQRKDEAKLKIDNLTREGKTQDAQLAKTEYERDALKRKADFIAAHPELADKANSAELEMPVAALAKEKAQTNQAQAATGASVAATDVSKEALKQSQEKNAATPAWIAALGDEEAQLYAQANKDHKTQSQIMADIAGGLHKGISRKNDKSGTSIEGYEGMAQALMLEWQALPPAQKIKEGSFDTWVQNNKQAPVGQATGNVLLRAKQILEQSGSPSSGAPAGNIGMRFMADKTMAGKSLGKTTPKGTEVISNGKVIGYYN